MNLGRLRVNNVHNNIKRRLVIHYFQALLSSQAAAQGWLTSCCTERRAR